MPKSDEEVAEKPAKDFLGMSDEEFSNINSPDVEDKPKVEASADPFEEKEKPAEPEKAEETPAADDGPDAGDTETADPVQESEEPVEEQAAKPVDAKVKVDEKKSEEKTAEKPVDYEQLFKQIMTPFKANGRTVELKTPEEAMRLMQMGAGYGKKIQDLQPHLKVIRMLEKNGLLDEQKLSFLIDLNQKNPDAIKKIIKDSGIDPLDLNTEDNVDYKPKNHGVSDKEVAFSTALSDVQAHPTGQETLKIINQTWDQQSKSLLWESPELLGVIQTQRDNGVYNQIAAEIDRQKMLGQIPYNAPFLQAYKTAGDHLMATNGFKNLPAQNQPVQPRGPNPPPQVIETRTAIPKSQVSNGDRAAAASPTKMVPRKNGVAVNPLAMADDEFLKQFKDRL